jgi:diguanylate cyclase (GGDEF)-like protein/PAS domain S-box-containing protein
MSRTAAGVPDPTSSTVASPRRLLRRALPPSTPLDEASWQRRHRILLGVLAAHALVLPLLGLQAGKPLAHTLAELAVVAALVAGGALAPSRWAREAFVAVGLVSCSVYLVHVVPGVPEVHFHFFVTVGALTMYQTWWPFLVAVGATLLHHGAVGEQLTAGRAGSWWWAGLHVAFLAAAAGTHLLAWRVNAFETAEAHGRLQGAQERFSTAFESAPIGMAMLDADGRHLQVNRAYVALTGHDRETLLGASPALTHPDDRAVEARALDQLVEGRVTSTAIDHRLVRADGAIRWVRRSSSLLRSASPPTIITQVEDVTEQRRAQELIRHRALHDGLTGLPNRTLLLDRLEQALATRRRRAERGDPVASVGLLSVDLDRFKQVNDTLGHDIADRVLLTVAQRIGAVLAPGDTVARIAGDEFVVLCPTTTAEEAEALARRIHRAIAEPVLLGPAEARVSVSVGLVLADAGEPGELLRDVDTAMHTAKERGRARTERFDVAQRARSTARFKIEMDLAAALERDEIVLAYQPTVDLRTGEVEGAEALVRWDHRDLGVLLPGDFLDVAEDTGLIVPVGLWVLHEACAQAARWQRAAHRDLVVAVNLSARQLDEPGLPETVERLLAAHRLSPSALRLELTESILLDAGSQTTPNLFALRDLGVSMGIDDFGTGYSSMTYLKRFPVDFLKIDRSFVQGLGADREDTAIVQAIIALGRALGLSVVGEGVERVEQAELLRDLGCHYGQGWLFGRPQEGGAISSGLRATHVA